MRHFASITAVITLIGCRASTYGNFIEDAPRGHEASLAADSARLVAELFPPANSTIAFFNTSEDPFGAALAAALRGRGFAVSEAPPTKSGRETVGLRYVIDRIDTLYRVSLLFFTRNGTVALARAYTPTARSVLPAGAWTRGAK